MFLYESHIRSIPNTLQFSNWVSSRKGLSTLTQTLHDPLCVFASIHWWNSPQLHFAYGNESHNEDWTNDAHGYEYKQVDFALRLHSRIRIRKEAAGTTRWPYVSHSILNANSNDSRYAWHYMRAHTIHPPLHGRPHCRMIQLNTTFEYRTLLRNKMALTYLWDYREDLPC